MAFIVQGNSVAANLVAQVYDAQFEIARARLDRADELASDAMSASQSSGFIGAVSLARDVDIPTPPPVDGFTAGELDSMYRGTAAEIKNLLAEGLTRFLTTYFPLGNELVLAQEWITKALTVGGSGINPLIEEQVWQRDRDRALKDAARATAQAMATWAARGYPLPPGALVGQVAMIDQDARGKVAETSRNAAIKQLEMELENVKFAVEKAISLRTAAIVAAGDYIKTLALGPKIGVELATSMVDAKAKIAGTLTSFYQAQVSALEIPVRIAIAQGQLNMDAAKASLASANDTARNRTDVAVAAMQQVGTQAAAALNALNANAGFSGSEQV